jgi:hypothetical protein
MDPNLVHLVRVTTEDGQSRLWAAATSREEAVSRVLQAVPEGWDARLMSNSLRPRRDAVQTMTPGEVRELAK